MPGDFRDRWGTVQMPSVGPEGSARAWGTGGEPMGWWSLLGLAQQFFYGIALLSSAVLVVQLLMSLIGFGADHDVAGGADVPGGVDVDHPDMEAHSSGLGMLSIKTVTAFLVGFGWGGVILLGYGLPILLAILGAALVGLAFLFMVFYLMKGIYRLSDSGNVDERNAAGCAGTVYLPVQANRAGTGQVQVIVQGRTREIPCVTDAGQSLPTGTHVRVTKVLEGGVALVERVEVEHE
jgi:membrane protein implicated in regulation of membrane protease activity